MRRSQRDPNYYSLTFEPTPAAIVADAINEIDLRLKAIPAGRGAVLVRDLRGAASPLHASDPMRFQRLDVETARRLYQLDSPITPREK